LKLTEFFRAVRAESYVSLDEALLLFRKRSVNVIVQVVEDMAVVHDNTFFKIVLAR